ncbi:MAG TPA: hypothetical protein VFS21_40360 [Roseiflexaceae bacterium]|nr:hypothetical protein [Roseiflexaceae bacterium]
MALTPEIVDALRHPFPAKAIKWKIRINPCEGEEWAFVVAYLDARHVAERLDLASAGDWSDSYAPPPMTAGNHISLACTLTVCGVSRIDVGSVPNPSTDDDATKDLYSDAFKRAAVKFGVGSHLYRFPKVQAKVEPYHNGKKTTYFLTREAEDQLEQLTHQLVSGTPLTTRSFPDLRIWGSAAGADGTPLQLQEEPAEKPKQTTTRTARLNGTNGANGASARVANGTNGIHTSTAVAPSPARLTSAREALRKAEQATGTAPAPTPTPAPASDKQRRYISGLIGDLSIDEAAISGLITLFAKQIPAIDGARLFSEPSYILGIPLSSKSASYIIEQLKAITNS